MHIMLTGLMPFGGDSTKEILSNVVKTQVDLTKPQFDAVSKHAKDLLKMIFDKNPENRPSADSVLSHPWFKSAWEAEFDEGALDKEIF